MFAVLPIIVTPVLVGHMGVEQSTLDDCQCYSLFATYDREQEKQSGLSVHDVFILILLVRNVHAA